MSFNYGDRLIICEQKVDVLQKDLANNLNRFAQAFGNKIQVDRTFQIYVDTVLTELKQDMEALFKHAGIEQPSKQRNTAISEEALAAELGRVEIGKDQSGVGADQPTDGGHQVSGGEPAGTLFDSSGRSIQQTEGK